MYPMIISPDAIVIAIDGKPETIGSDHANYTLLLDAIRNSEWAKVPNLVTVAKAVKAFVDSSGVNVTNGEVTYKGYVVHSSVSDKILDLMEQGFDVTPLSRFLARVENNPLITARQELYNFCEANGFMIDTQGYMIAYKAVNSNYKDKYTGRMDNSVGAIVSMPRTDVDADRNRTCSAGLHFAAFDYAARVYGNVATGTDKLMVVRIDPADVVAIPTDYNRQKGRAWRYQVVAEVSNGQPLTHTTFRAEDFKLPNPTPEVPVAVPSVQKSKVPSVAPSVSSTDLSRNDVRAALNACDGIIGGATGAASRVGLTPRSFRRRMQKFGISR